MSWWEITNSPIVLTLITLVWGSAVASWVTALWQRRSHRHEVKLQYVQDVINSYQEYIRLVKGSPTRLEGEDFDEVHSRMLSQAKVAGLLFKDKSVGQGWKLVIDKLANVRALRLEERDSTLTEKKLHQVFAEGDIAIERMFKELQ
jgi:hypothetical protein